MIMNFNVNFNFRNIKYMFLMDNRLQLTNGTVQWIFMDNLVFSPQISIYFRGNKIAREHHLLKAECTV